MNLFISWSTDKSKKVGDIFCKYLPQIIQDIKPWFSPLSIEAGSMWDSAINKGLQTDFGLVILTHGNKEKPWIQFESGALYKGLDKTRVFTFLVDMEPKDLLDNPLTKFNHTSNNKESILKLLTTINEHLGDKKLSEAILGEVYERTYPVMESAITKVLAEDVFNIAVAPSTEALLSEILSTVRDVSKRLDNLENGQSLSSQEDPFQFARPYFLRSKSNPWQPIKGSDLYNPYSIPADPSVHQQEQDAIKEFAKLSKRFNQNPKPPQKDGEST